MTLIAADTQEPVFEATAFEICFKFSVNMCWKEFALNIQVLNQGRVVLLYQLVE